jgi:hypothetical protein
MNMRQILLANTAIMLLAMGPAWAAPGGVPGPNPNAPGQIAKALGQIANAPEIDAESGTGAIALLTGVLLLVGERSRSKRSSESDE